MSDLAAQITEKLETFNKGVLAAQEEHAKHFDDRIDALGKEVIKKASEEATKSLEEVNALKDKIKALEDSNTVLQKQIFATGSNAANDDPLIRKSRSQLLDYLCKGKPVTDEVIEDMCLSIARKSMKNATDAEQRLCAKAMMAGNDPNGGYLVRTEISNKLITRTFESVPMRSLATVITINSDSIELPIDDEEITTGGWVGEVEERAETGNPEIGKLVIFVHEMYAQPLVTRKLLDDAAIDVESWLNNKVADKFSRDQNKAFVNGDGSQKPRGFLTYPAWTSNGQYERHKLEQINLGSATGVTGDGFKKLKIALHEEYQRNARWLMRRETFEEVITQKDGMGRYLLNPNSYRDGDDQILLGKPVVFAYDMPIIAGNALPVAYGDFARGYTIVDRIGVRIIRDELTKKPFVKFYTTLRVGGAVTNYEAIKIGKIAV